MKVVERMANIVAISPENKVDGEQLIADVFTVDEERCMLLN